MFFVVSFQMIYIYNQNETNLKDTSGVR